MVSFQITVCAFREYCLNVLAAQFCFIVLLDIFQPCSAKSTNRLLVISFDGFRWDYVHKANNLTNIHRMINDGGWAISGIKNTFLTKTFPNHYTIATGLYEESHGIVGNAMYDPSLNETFHGWIEKDARNSRWWDNGGEPIWVTNQKQDTQHRSGVLAWPGGLARVKGVLAYKVESAFDGLTMTERAKKMIEWLTDDYPINLGLYYEEEPDKTGHKFGPNSTEVKSKILELDDLLGYILYKLEDNDLLKTTNIILTSDHGMTSISKDNETYKINLDDYININSYNITSKSPVAGIDAFPPTKGNFYGYCCIRHVINWSIIKLFNSTDNM